MMLTPALLTALLAQSPSPADTLHATWTATAHDAEAFYRPVAAAITRGDEVWVLDGGNSLAYVFDLEGNATRTVGGKGGGPGEFISPSLLIERGDTIVVWDRHQQRLTFLDLEGNFIKSREIPLMPTVHGFARSLALKGDTAWVFTDNYPSPEPRDNESLSEIWRFVQGRFEGRRVFNVPGRAMRIQRSSLGASRHPAPFARAPFVSFLPDETFLYGNSGTGHFLRFDRMSPVDTVSLTLPRLSVTREEREAFGDSVRRALEAGFARSGVGPTYRDQYRRDLETFLAETRFPDDHPAYLLAKVIDGDLWLLLPTRASARYHDLRSFDLSDGSQRSQSLLPKWGTLIEFDVSPHGLVALEISRDTEERRVAMFRSSFPATGR